MYIYIYTCGRYINIYYAVVVGAPYIYMYNTQAMVKLHGIGDMVIPNGCPGRRTKPLPGGGYQVQKGEKHEANYHVPAVCQRNATQWMAVDDHLARSPLTMWKDNGIPKQHRCQSCFESNRPSTRLNKWQAQAQRRAKKCGKLLRRQLQENQNWEKPATNAGTYNYVAQAKGTGRSRWHQKSSGQQIHIVHAQQHPNAHAASNQPYSQDRKLCNLQAP